MKRYGGIFSFKRSNLDKKQPDDDLELEKGDLTAMLLAALFTFGPLVVIISAIYIAIAFLFGMQI